MKFTLTFKTPHVVEQAAEKYMNTHCEDHEEHNPSCDACIDREEVACEKLKEIGDTAKEFVQYGEYIIVEFDTDTQTAIVLHNRK